jgi:hypothetical protein
MRRKEGALAGLATGGSNQHRSRDGGVGPPWAVNVVVGFRYGLRLDVKFTVGFGLLTF